MSLTKSKILSAIRAAAHKLGHAPTRAEFMRLSGIHYCRLIPLFPGGYRAAIRAAGLAPHPNGVRIATADMLTDWGRLARKLGRVPTREEYDRHGRYATASLETRFHRWSRVHTCFVQFVEAGGLSPQWADVVKKIRGGPIPTRGGGKSWLNRPRLKPVAVNSDSRGAKPPHPLILPPPLHGKHCVTATMFAVIFSIALFAQSATPQRDIPGKQKPNQNLAASFPRRVLPGRPVMGPPASLPGLAHDPVNEMGVVFLFGQVAHRLGFIVDSLQSGFPDCEARMEVEPGRWQRVRIEFEYASRTFRAHRHDPAQCDVIVCWRHNWRTCPPNLQVLELSSVIRRLTSQARPSIRT